MSNMDIRSAIERAGIRYWQVADELGIADSTFSRKLRKELPTEEKTHIFSIIERLSGEVA